jgi:hypothetical protein
VQYVDGGNVNEYVFDVEQALKVHVTGRGEVFSTVCGFLSDTFPLFSFCSLVGSLMTRVRNSEARVNRKTVISAEEFNETLNVAEMLEAEFCLHFAFLLGLLIKSRRQRLRLCP